MRYLCTIFILVILLTAGCKKEKEILSGNLLGKVRIINQDQSYASDNSGVMVNLFDADGYQISAAISESTGKYEFSDIPYGKYKIDLQKDNYLEGYDFLKGYTFSHIGGYSPTLKDFYIYEIPKFALSVDSVKAVPAENRIKIYLKVNGDTVMPFAYYGLLGFFGSNPDVSATNYAGIGMGVAGNIIAWYDFDMSAYIFDFYTNLTGPVYMRFYLLTQGQSVYTRPVNVNALGQPSNVVSFVWNQ